MKKSLYVVLLLLIVGGCVLLLMFSGYFGNSKRGDSPQAGPLQNVDQQTNSQSKTIQSSVTVSTDKKTYARGDTMLITINNQWDAAIVVPVLNANSFCSIFELEIIRNGVWQTTGDCIATAPQKDPPDTTKLLQYSHYGLKGLLSKTQTLEVGKYRIAFNYGPGIAYSDEFQINDSPTTIDNTCVTDIDCGHAQCGNCITKGSEPVPAIDPSAIWCFPGYYKEATPQACQCVQNKCQYAVVAPTTATPK